MEDTLREYQLIADVGIGAPGNVILYDYTIGELDHGPIPHIASREGSFSRFIFLCRDRLIGRT
jgi:hypothetical protein